STDGHTYISSTDMSNPGFGLRCIFLSHGTNVTSTKQTVNSITGLVAADSDTGQIFPARIDLPSAPAFVTSRVGTKSGAGPTRPASGLGLEERRRRVGVEARSAVAATVAGASPLDGTPTP